MDYPIIPNSEQPLNQRLIKASNEYFDLQTYWIIYEEKPLDSMLTKYNQHTFYELQFVLDGAINQLCDDKEKNRHLFSIQSNEFVIIPPKLPHQITFAEEKTKKFKLGFDFNPHNEELKKTLEILCAPQKYTATKRSRKYVDLMLDLVHSPTSWSNHQIQAQLECLVLDLFETVYASRTIINTEVSHKINRPNNLLREIESIIHDKINTQLSADYIASAVGLSSRQINRILSQNYHKTIKDLINEERLRYVKEIIAKSDLSLGEIAEICGYSNEYALNRFFKDAEGYTLSQYKYMTLSQRLP